MNKKYTSKKIKLEDLVLDKENPRFAELYNGSDKESDIIEYLLYTESANEIAEAISGAGEFYEDRPLWVLKKNAKYIVKDGNRRCSAVKALQMPNNYGLDVTRFQINELPVLEYHDLADLETRIRLEHNSNLFKKWGRIAKSLEIYRLFSSGSSITSLNDIDSKPKEFIKIATFYHEAVKIKGEYFKKLVREGKGKTGGKTIVFERLFKSRSSCGYNFKRTTSEIMIKDPQLFTSYINAIVPYLADNPDTTSREIDTIGTDSFMSKLKPYGFPPKKQSTSSDSDNNTSNAKHTESNNSQNNHSSTSSSDSKSNSKGTRHSTKNKPTLKRKQIPSPLKKLINETYKLDHNNFSNAKITLARVSFECTLKFIVENTTKANGRSIGTSNHFILAYETKNHKPLPSMNFGILKTKFTEIISDTGIRKAFEDFDLQRSHQIIHNYRVGALPSDAKAICDNLIDLIEFMLQDEKDLLNSIDSTKL